MKFDQSELDKIKSLQDRYQESLIVFGRLNIDRLNLEESIKMLSEAESRAKEDFFKLQKEESDLVDSLSSKYGNGVLSLKDGTFSPDSK